MLLIFGGILIGRENDLLPLVGGVLVTTLVVRYTRFETAIEYRSDVVSG